MLLYALTGGAGCGKSTVSEFFSADGGWRIIDADALCAKLYANPHSALTKEITAHFGTVKADGTVDKKALADKVFNNRNELDFLNRTAHKHIHDEVERIKKEYEGQGVAHALLDAPLLYESGWDQLAYKVIAVWTSPQIQKERLLKRGWDEKEIARRLANQLGADEKLKRADYGLINNGTREELREQCIALSRKLLDGESHTSVI